MHNNISWVPFVLFQLKKSQIHIEDILTAKGILFEKIDISAPQQEDKKTFMRENATAPGGKTPLPPQLFLEDEYCGVSTLVYQYSLFFLHAQHVFVASDKRGIHLHVYFSYCPQKLNLVLIRSALVSTSYEYYNVHFHREIRKIYVLRFWLKKKATLSGATVCVVGTH